MCEPLFVEYPVAVFLASISCLTLLSESVVALADCLASKLETLNEMKIFKLLAALKFVH